jgi:hypothetical protein
MSEETMVEQNKTIKRRGWSKKARKSVKLSHALKRYWENMTPTQRAVRVAGLKKNGGGLKSGYVLREELIQEHFARGVCIGCLALIHATERRDIEDCIRRGG